MFIVPNSRDWYNNNNYYYCHWYRVHIVIMEMFRNTYRNMLSVPLEHELILDGHR